MNKISTKKIAKWVLTPIATGLFGKMFVRNIAFVLAVFWAISATSTFAQAPLDYYSQANNQSGYALKTALHNIIKNHTELSYSELWTAFLSTDIKFGTDDKIWDMYSNSDYTYSSDQCKSTQRDCYNREHSFPKSWFNDGYPMYTDLFHLYPVDGYVNTMRNNNPYGEVSNPTYTSDNGSKLGSCSNCSGYTKKVFEPIDEYKGDFARTYFYMVTRYEDKVETWNTDMLDGTRNQAFSDWAKTILMKWHRQDTVSEKEIKRNNAVYEKQHNRNPFIDHPEFAEKIWGGDDTPFVAPFSANETLEVAIEDYPKAEVYSVSGVLLKKLNSSDVETFINELPHSVYLVRYINKSTGKSIFKKFVR
jgi:endonuclease I